FVGLAPDRQLELPFIAVLVPPPRRRPAPGLVEVADLFAPLDDLVPGVHRRIQVNAILKREERGDESDHRLPPSALSDGEPGGLCRPIAPRGLSGPRPRWPEGRRAPCRDRCPSRQRRRAAGCRGI